MSPERLTLAQAQERVDAILKREGVPYYIDWSAPVRAARLLAIDNALVGRATSLTIAKSEVITALDAYASHLDFEAGRAFELAAVERYRAQCFREERERAGRDVLAALGLGLKEGYHLAGEPESPEAP